VHFVLVVNLSTVVPTFWLDRLKPLQGL